MFQLLLNRWWYLYPRTSLECPVSLKEVLSELFFSRNLLYVVLVLDLHDCFHEDFVRGFPGVLHR